MSEYTITATNPETSYLEKSGSVWDTVWGSATGVGYEDQFYYEAECYYISPKYYLSRGRVRFDTSTITGTVASATLRIAFNKIVTNKGNNYLHIVGAVGCGDEMATTDYAALKNNTTNICSPIQVSSITPDTYIERELNATGIALINTAGYTIIGLRLDDDISNTPPVDGSKEVWLSWYGGVYAPGPSGYEAKLDIVTASVYPTVGTTRVTGIIHRNSPGNYTMEVALGGVTTDFGVPPISREPQPAIPTEPTFVCLICGAAFPTLPHLVMHSFLEHGPIPPPTLV